MLTHFVTSDASEATRPLLAGWCALVPAGLRYLCGAQVFHARFAKVYLLPGFIFLLSSYLFVVVLLL